MELLEGTDNHKSSTSIQSFSIIEVFPDLHEGLIN